MRARFGYLLLCIGLVWCMDFALRHSILRFRPAEQAPVNEIVQVQHCQTLSDWNAGDQWPFLADPNSEGKPFLVTNNTKYGEETVVMKCNTISFARKAPEPLAPANLAPADGLSVFWELRKRHWLPEPTLFRQPKDELWERK